MTTWCRFKTDERTSYGIVEGDQVIAVDGTPFGAHRRKWRRLPARQRQTADPGGAADFLLRRH
jgi:Rv2993c-like, N-terminal